MAIEWDQISTLDGIGEVRLCLDTPDSFGEKNYHTGGGNTNFTRPSRRTSPRTRSSPNARVTVVEQDEGGRQAARPARGEPLRRSDRQDRGGHRAATSAGSSSTRRSAPRSGKPSRPPAWAARLLAARARPVPLRRPGQRAAPPAGPRLHRRRRLPLPPARRPSTFAGGEWTPHALKQVEKPWKTTRTSVPSVSRLGKREAPSQRGLRPPVGRNGQAPKQKG